MRTLTLLCCSALAVSVLPPFLAAAPDDSTSHTLKAADAAAGWDELQGASRPPEAPEAWHTTPPTPAERSSFYMPFVLAVEDKAKDFYSKFPGDAHTVDARKQEFSMTLVAIELGATNQQSRLDAEEKSLLNDPAMTEKDRANIRNSKLQMQFQLAMSSEPDKARPIFQEIADSKTAPEEAKAQAVSELKKLDSIGKPVDLQFTAVDGREVDVAKLKGKVVLIDFWATWCGPCVGELPHVKEAYEKLHPQGFEIVGISLDKDKDKLTQFVGEHQMAWSQFFDGQGWQNKYARQFGIESIPAMWLVDKKGALRDIDARDGLSDKIAKLLAE